MKVKGECSTWGGSIAYYRMKVIFCTMMFEDVEKEIKNSKSPNPISGHKFQENLIKGLTANECKIDIINISRVRAYPDYNKLIFLTKDFFLENSKRGKSIGFINLKGLNYLSQYIVLYKELKKRIRSNIDEKCVIVTFNSYLIPSSVMLRLKKRFQNVILCDIIGDLHGKYGVKSADDGIKQKVISFIGKKQDCMAKKFDCFVFHTEQMAEALGVKEKPYSVMECPYDVGDKESSLEYYEDDVKRVFYAGALRKEYGIEHLINAFMRIDGEEYRLLIAGNGEMQDYVKQSCTEDKRISYLGFISPSEVEKYQREATVLINPRTSEHEFVKYSFPSKSMEALASMKSYIAHRLPCIPKEYDEYILYPLDETDIALSNKIIEVCNWSFVERKTRGLRARRFIIEEKNPKALCKRITDMWRRNYGD